MEKKKHKKPKKLPNTHQAMTGFEKAFEQFATSAVINSSNTTDGGSDSGNPLSPKQSDIPPESKLDVSVTQFRAVHLGEFCFFALKTLFRNARVKQTNKKMMAWNQCVFSGKLL